MTRHTVTDDGNGRKYWTQTPNIVFDLGLRPFPLALYGQLKRIAGQDGQCDETTRQLAARMACSPMAISKALVELALPRADLGGKALVNVVKVADGKGARFARNAVALVDIWPENMARYGGPAVNTVDGAVNNMYGAVNTVYGGRTHSVHPKEPKKNKETDTGAPTAPAANGTRRDAPPTPKPRKTRAASPLAGLAEIIMEDLTGRRAQPDRRHASLIWPLVGDIGGMTGDNPVAAGAVWLAFKEAREEGDTWRYVKPHNARDEYGRWAANGGASTIAATLAMFGACGTEEGG